MKQINYNYSLKELSTIVARMEDLEDGYWELSFLFEQLATPIAQTNPSQQQGVFPGTVTRIVGAQLYRLPDGNPTPHSVLVRNGQIISQTEVINGIDRNNSGSQQSGEGPGGYSRPTSEYISEFRPLGDRVTN